MYETNLYYYKLFLPYYKQIRVFTRGMQDVQYYLKSITNKTDPDSIIRNRDYKSRAQYTNFSARTRNALSGAVFRKEPIINMPTKLQYLINDSNGAGLSIEQTAKSLISNLIEVGRHGLFVDYGNSAKIVSYIAENIYDYEVDEIGNLTKVVLITGKTSRKHLVLNDGIYQVEVYLDDAKTNIIIPTKADGKTLDYIPFVFCGSVNNSPDFDEMPLWSIVDISNGHYQNSADYEDILGFMLPTPWMNGVTDSFKETMYPDGFVQFGSGAMIVAPPDGQVGLLQASANQMHQEAMKHKEEQLVMLGARLIMGGSAQETAEAVKIKFSSENSVLDNLVGNATDAIRQCLEWCSEFMGVEGDIEYKLNREFWDSKMSEGMVKEYKDSFIQGIVSWETLMQTLINGGVYPTLTPDDLELEKERLSNGV